MNSPHSFSRVFFICLLQSISIGLAFVTMVTVSVFLFAPLAHAVDNPYAASELVRLDNIQQGSLLFKTDQQRLYQQAPLLKTDVQMDITAMTARVRVRQSFYNKSQEWVEGIYVFPLPDNAAVDHLRMKIGERIIEGQIKERQQARQIYEKAKRSGHKAALIEQERPNLFTNSVANIGPGETIIVEIEYQQTLSYINQTFAIRFPLAITPRYIPGSTQPVTEELTVVNGSGWAMNTAQVPDASHITPPAVKDNSLNPVNIQVNLNAGIPLQDIQSLYHPVQVTRGKNGKAKIQLQEQSVPADRDFVLEWKPLPSHAPRAALFTEAADDNKHYSLLMVMPPVTGRNSRQLLPREVVFIIDTSGSMGGESIRQARAALGMAVKRLKPADRFNIIEFNSSSYSLFEQPIAVTQSTINQALSFVNGLQARGGTEMRTALQKALSYPANPDFIQQVIFLTDGAVGNEAELFQVIQHDLDKVRLFTVGIGSAPNSHFMRKAAQFGRGTFTYIGNITEVNKHMQSLFSKLETPIMTNLKINWPGNADIYPKRLSDLYDGEPLILSIAHEPVTAKGDKVTISGQRGQQPWKASFPLNGNVSQSGPAVLWARNRISDLIDSLHDGADKMAVRQSVINTALKHHLVSKYTSLVAVDVTPTRPVEADLKKKTLAGNLPHGMTQNPTRVAMPQTATSSQLHMLTGFILLLMGIIWGWCSSHRTPRWMSA